MRYRHQASLFTAREWRAHASRPGGVGDRARIEGYAAGTTLANALRSAAVETGLLT